MFPRPAVRAAGRAWHFYDGAGRGASPTAQKTLTAGPPCGMVNDKTRGTGWKTATPSSGSWTAMCGMAHARVVATKEVVHFIDARKDDPGYVARDPFVVAAVEVAGIRTLIVVPMLKDDELVGFIRVLVNLNTVDQTGYPHQVKFKTQFVGLFF